MKSGKEKLNVNIFILLLAVINVIIHLLVINNLGYHRDELLYFSLGLHPSTGYETVPPMIGWIAWLMHHLFGFSLFAVRIFPALMGGVMVFLVSAIARELGGGSYARVLAAMALMISGISLRTFELFQPVHIDLFFWTILFYVILRYVNTGSGRYLVLIGVVGGLSLLNKYLIGVLFISLLAVIPFTSYRKIFADRKFWIGLILGLLIFIPNLVWQFTHHLPVFHHLSELERTQLVNVDRKGFLFDQLMMPGLASFVSVAGIIWLLTVKSAARYRFLGFVSLLVVGILFLLKGKSYYTIGIFPLLFAAGAVSWSYVFKKSYTRALFLAALVGLTIPIIPMSLPVCKPECLVRYFSNVEKKYGFNSIRRFEDGSIHSLPQDYADMLGWRELTRITAKAWDMIPDKKAAFIYCENYGQAGAITVIGRKYGLPEAVSFNESFIYWIPRQFDPDIKYFIYINNELGKDVKAIFKKVILVGKITNPYAREFGTQVYLCGDPTGSFNAFWTARLEKLKTE
ncbi:MAG TPA: glycosyltransferase family 39 protein [Bacteroidales bacterium]|nr:glycosyltransferase family 39 protein [Bacteroidales bacterium]